MNCITLLTKYYQGDQIKKGEMGSTFGTLGERKCISGGNLPKRGHLKNKGKNGKTI